MPEVLDSSCIDDGDTSWVLISTILVLGMMPALAFFELGLLRVKNSLSLINQIFGGLVALGFLWDIIGFSLVYGDSLGGFIGKPWQYWALVNVGYDDCHSNAPTIPSAAFALFQMMFAAITPLLMTGAYAERVNWRSFFIFTILWEFLVYYPVAHWIWGGGWLDKMGVLDFAGGIVIHTSAGASGLVIAIVIGRRKGFDQFHGEWPPSNLPLAALGAALLWMGWFGFNAGSALQAGSVATSAVASTQIAACTSGLVWLIISWIRNKPSTIALINGVIAGLAGITPASGYISSQATLLVGLILGLASYFSVILMKHKLRIDDALDVSSVHGLTGIIGALMIGVFSEKSLNPNGADGMIHGEFRLFGVQVLAVVVVTAYSAVITLILLLILRRLLGFRVSDAEEDMGVDHTEHGEAAYAEFAMVGYADHHEEGSFSHVQNNPAEMKKRRSADEKTPLKEDL